MYRDSCFDDLPMASVRLTVCLSVPSAYSPLLIRGQHATCQHTFRPDCKDYLTC